MAPASSAVIVIGIESARVNGRLVVVPLDQPSENFYEHPSLPQCCAPNAFKLLARQVEAINSPDALLKRRGGHFHASDEGVNPPGPTARFRIC